MKRTINLTLGRKRVDNALKKIFYATVVVFSISVVVSLGLITYRLILKGTYDALESREQEFNSQLLAQQEKKDKLLEIKSRISEIRKILSNRAPMTVRLDTLSSIVPPTSQVNSLAGDDVDVQMTIESEDLSSLSELLEQKIAELASDKKKGIKRIEMRSFGLNPKTLKYNISFGIEFI